MIEPERAREPPLGSDPLARTPLRLARLIAIKAGEEDGDADQDRLGIDATIEVAWIYRREELGLYEQSDRVYGREVILSDVRESGVGARRLRGKFKLEHISTVDSLSQDPMEAHSIFNSDPFAFWAEFTLSNFKKSNRNKEDASSIKPVTRRHVSEQEVNEIRCSRCHEEEQKNLGRETKVSAQQSAFELPNLALYAGAGFLGEFEFPSQIKKCC